MFKKVLVSLLMLSQLTTFAFAGNSSATAETTLLKTVVALQGENLSQAEMQAQLKAAVSKYLANAPQQGQQERMEQALVALNIYTPEQAHGFVTDAHSAAARVENAKISGEQLSNTMNSEMSKLAGLHPAGAQFSACAISAVGIFTGAIAGGILMDNQPTDSARGEAGEALFIVSFFVGLGLVGVC